jgi:hypothetical protein
MSSRLFPLATNSSILLSISLHTPITTKAMVVIAKGWNMQKESYEWCLLAEKCNFTGGSNAGMVITFVVVESSIVQSKSPLS